MDVDIDVGRIDADEQHVKGIASGYQQFFVSVHDCMMQVSVPDVAIIDEKILLTAGFFFRLGEGFTVDLMMAYLCFSSSNLISVFVGWTLISMWAGSMLMNSM